MKKLNYLIKMAVIICSASKALAILPVAVFSEDGFPTIGGIPSFPPSKIIETLTELGIEAHAVSAEDMCNSNNLNSGKYFALVLPYGNAFPIAAFENLQKFHKSGGCFITTSIPFFNPYIKIDGTWKEWTNPSQLSFIRNDAFGFGTGGYGDPKPNQNISITVPGHPVGITENMLPTDLKNHQWLDIQALAASDQVIPIVNMIIDGRQRIGMALIRHLGRNYHGARDVWMGQMAEGSDASDRYFAKQVLTRGIYWCALERGLINTEVFKSEIARLDKVEKPKPLPANLTYAVTPRPWGNTYLPKSKTPARHLIAIDVEHLSKDQRIAVTCLQGLTSRSWPQIWIIRRPEDKDWLDWHKEKKYIDDYEIITKPELLFKRFSNVFKGAIIPDTKLYRGDLLALNIAECDDLIVASPELARELNLPIKMDLRDRFKTYAEGMNWVWSHYKNQLNHQLCKYAYPPLLADCNFAYDFEWHSVMFWIAGPKDESKYGADHFEELDLMSRIFSEMDPNIGVLGFPYGGENIGIGENEGVSFASRYAKGLVCSDFLCNLCVMSGVDVGNLTQPRQLPAPKLDANAIYIALIMSDGDNQNTWMSLFKKYFSSPAFGKFPVSFGMGPAIHDLMPAVSLWYYEHASRNTEFIADVSGAAYIEPEDYGVAYSNQKVAFSDFLAWTSRLMKEMGMNSVRPNGGDDNIQLLYSQALPFCYGIFPNTGSYPIKQGIDQLTYSLRNGTPLFRTVESEKFGKDGFFRVIMEQVRSQRPAFVNACISTWVFSPEDLARIYDQKGTNIVFVTPSQLAELYREAQKKGLIR
ncbi:MAG TPA: GxGYxYP domain-containing protein [Verrucomicrobiae bacterium]|jgi:hypothetical protein